MQNANVTCASCDGGRGIVSVTLNGLVVVVTVSQASSTTATATSVAVMLNDDEGKPTASASGALAGARPIATQGGWATRRAGRGNATSARVGWRGRGDAAGGAWEGSGRAAGSTCARVGERVAGRRR